MKIIISPAKKMLISSDNFGDIKRPQYFEQTQIILQALRQLTYDDLKVLWKCSDKLAQKNYQQLHQIDLTKQLTPAILAYSGIQYQYMAPDLFTVPEFNYVQQHLRILSGFYGILRPFDGVVPYRLEMQTTLAVVGSQNLYAFWNRQLYEALIKDGEPIINLASQEYSQTIAKYLTPADRMIEIVFGHFVDGRIKTRATLAKMARGQMVRFMAEHQVHRVTELQEFTDLNYQYRPEFSTANKLVFLTQ
ncbi:peroxide stress protein YaaA [Lapidilactobacillus bayanensis]|uniref:peroxide stress protein YaaA n=1 Tax=Lapidilactobacillus bayanensis TaxID=2485998 RepID=UPI000F7B5798|nr:peroxide stress protein YaaA [Lapidilactobacillus bayanensis]